MPRLLPFAAGIYLENFNLIDVEIDEVGTALTVL
jgi:hypothetical protein